MDNVASEKVLISFVFMFRRMRLLVGLLHFIDISGISGTICESELGSSIFDNVFQFRYKAT